MRKNIIAVIALILASAFGFLQFGSGTAFAQPAATAQQQGDPAVQTAQSSYPQAQTRPARMIQYFFGTVEKKNGKFVLSTVGKTYKLNRQSKVAKYNRKQVEVIGTLASNMKTIHIQKIKPIKKSS